MWNTTAAAGLGNMIAMANDEYGGGDYDVRVWERERVQNPKSTTGFGERVQACAIATSSRFEARPSIAYDAKGRLWIAYEEGPEQWGKDYGALTPATATRCTTSAPSASSA